MNGTEEVGKSAIIIVQLGSQAEGTIMLGLHITTLTINNFDRFDSDAQISYLYLYPSPEAKAFNSVMGSNARECSNGLKYKLGSEVWSVNSKKK